MSEPTGTEAEVARVNWWNDRLAETWSELCSLNSTATKVEYIHRFVSSFNALSKARRELGGLDAVVRKQLDINVTGTDSPPVSIDAEVEALSKKLAFNDIEQGT